MTGSLSSRKASKLQWNWSEGEAASLRRSWSGKTPRTVKFQCGRQTRWKLVNHLRSWKSPALKTMGTKCWRKFSKMALWSIRFSIWGSGCRLSRRLRLIQSRPCRRKFLDTSWIIIGLRTNLKWRAIMQITTEIRLSLERKSLRL